MYSCTRAMEEEGVGKSWLGLGIGGGGDLMKRNNRPPVQLDDLLSFPPQSVAAASKKQAEKGGGGRKRHKIVVTADEDGRQSPHGGARKKLRLTKAQSTLLEDTFRAHNILSHAQKQELARQVNLSARQVEVWFQNRRARTKLKQTEADCEVLKRYCERLTGENQRLRLELAQLQRSPAAEEAGFYVQSSFPFPPLATAMASVCPSCDKVVAVTSGKSSTSYSS
ncbi:Homeobox-leucine zipper protein HOX18 [Zea mays]|uniref:Homeobox-leucine zipper protein HOX18 n=2 Tax=Zea mays TaxID=4577 RepID=A0A3L6EFA6_MAIZE|nr:homeobox-leucine zipper protein HOX18 [Zea mays]PWZ19729.1 Homeobox-leucine zipper protein HOX18 [Zea mays]|eukprot:XP_008645010.1 homeobox-leucine zipper protein HOX18 [Zea mays]